MRKLNDEEKAQMRQIKNLKFCADCQRCKARQVAHEGKLSLAYYCMPAHPFTEPLAAFRRRLGGLPLHLALDIAKRNVAYSYGKEIKISCSGHASKEERLDCSSMKERVADDLNKLLKQEG